jgi:hypothetical protein
MTDARPGRPAVTRSNLVDTLRRLGYPQAAEDAARAGAVSGRRR